MVKLNLFLYPLLVLVLMLMGFIVFYFLQYNDLCVEDTEITFKEFMMFKNSSYNYIRVLPSDEEIEILLRFAYDRSIMNISKNNKTYYIGDFEIKLNGLGNDILIYKWDTYNRNLLYIHRKYISDNSYNLSEIIDIFNYLKFCKSIFY